MRRLIAAGVAVMLALTGCGVTPQDEPHGVELPRRPLITVSPVPAAPGGAGNVAEVLCLVRDGRLVEIVRRVESPSTAQGQLDQLLAGPTEAERNNGITTALTGLSLSVSLAAGTNASRVEVTEADDDTGRSDETIAFGQIVCTLTSRPDVGSVTFTKSGEQLEVPRADGQLSRGPLYAGDFATLVAER